MSVLVYVDPEQDQIQFYEFPPTKKKKKYKKNLGVQTFDWQSTLKDKEYTCTSSLVHEQRARRSVCLGRLCNL